MAGSTDSFLSLAKGLEENLGAAVKQLKSFNDVSQNVNKSFSTVNKSLNTTNDVSQQINDNYDNIGESTKRVDSATSKWGKTLSGILPSLKGILGIFTAGMAGLGFVDAIRGAVELHQNMRDLGYQMGLGTKGAKRLEDGIMNISAATGFALGEVTAMVSTLTKMKVPLANMERLATDSLRFSEITGASQSQIAKMTGGLVTMGGMGAKSIGNMMATIVQTQRAFGMTGESVGVLADNITDTTMTLKNMGRSSNEIEKFQKGTVKLAGAFASVGIEASTATDLINRMLDPGKLENNALLFAKMGISIEDAMSGNIDPGKLVSGLQGIGAELKDMAGPQASALAGALGIPLNQLRQMGNMDASGIEKMAKEMGMIANGSDQLAGAQDDQATAQRDMAQVFEKIKGTLGNIVIKLMPAFDIIAKLINENMGKILGWVNKIVNAGFIEKFIGGLANGIKFVGSGIGKVIDGIGKLFSHLSPKTLLLGLVALIGGIIFFKKKFASVATDSSGAMTSSFKGASVEIGREISRGISSGLEMAAEKGSKVLKAKMGQASKVTSDDLSTRIREGTQYAAIDAAAEYQKLLSGQNTFGWAKKMNASTSEWLDKIKEGGKPISMFASYYKNTQAAIMEKIKMSGVDYKNESESIKTRLEGQSSYGDSLKERQLQLERMATTTKLSLEQNWELEKIGKALLKNSKEQEKSEIELGALAKKASDIKEAYVKKLAPDALKTYTDELNLKNESLLKDKQSLTERNGIIEKEKITLGLVNNALKLRKDEIDLRLVAGTASFEDMENLKRINSTLSENVDLTKQLDEEASKNAASIITTDEAINKMGEDLLVAKKAAEGITTGDNGQMFKSFGQNIKDAITGGAGIFKTKFTDLGKKIGDSIHGASKAVAERMNPKNWIAAVRTAGDGNLFKGAATILASGIKGAVKGIGGVIGGVSKVGSKIANSKGGKAIRKLGSTSRTAGRVAGGLAIGGTALLIGAMMKSEKGKEVMEKIQEKIAEVMAKIMPMISTLIDNLMPIATGLIDFLMPLIDKMMPVIQDIMASVMPMIQGFFESLMPMFKQLVPVVMGLVKSLLPPIISLISALMPIFNMLVKFLLPPILKVLSFLLGVLGTLITAIGDAVSIFNKDIGAGIKAVGIGMKDAANGMSRSADLMTGAIAELTTSMTAEQLKAAERAVQVDNLNKNTKLMSSTLGITAEESSKVTVEDITAKLAGNKGTKDLIYQMDLNNKELAKQYTLIAAQNLANTTARLLKEKGEAGQAEALSRALSTDTMKWGNVSGMTGGNETLASNLAQSGKLDDLVLAIKESGGVDADIFERFQEDFRKAGFASLDAYEGSQAQILKFVEQQTASAARNGLTTSDARSIITQMANASRGTAEGSALSALSERDVAELVTKSKGDAEQLNSLLREMFQQQGGALSEAGIKKVFADNIAYTMSGISEMTNRTEAARLTREINAIKNDTQYNNDEQKRSDALLEYLRKNDTALGSQIKGVLSAQIVARAEAAAGNPEVNTPAATTPTTTTTEPPRGSIETKLYPAMLSAISGVNGALGFIQTADARTVTSGMTDAEVQQMKLDEQIRLLGELVKIGGLSKEATEAVAVATQDLNKQQSAASTAQQMNSAGTTPSP